MFHVKHIVDNVVIQGLSILICIFNIIIQDFRKYIFNIVNR